jgi:hypothetical protein
MENNDYYIFLIQSMSDPLNPVIRYVSLIKNMPSKEAAIKHWCYENKIPEGRANDTLDRWAGFPIVCVQI